MNLSTNWRDRRTVFKPPHNFSIVNYSTETKRDFQATFGDELFLNNLHLIPDPLKKNLADTIITEDKMAPKSKETPIGVETNANMLNQPDYSRLSGITNFFSGVMNVITNAMFSKRKQSDFGEENGGQMAVPPLWHGAKASDENKILQDENCSNDMGGELLVSDMTDCRKAVAHCQSKIEQVRLLLGTHSQPVPCNFRRRRPKKVFVEAGSVEDCFEDAFSPEDFENIANDSYLQYSSPVCYHDHVFHEVEAPKVKVETARMSEAVAEPTPVCETTEIVKNVPETETIDSNVNTDTKQELVASCEDKISKLKALLERRKKTTPIEPPPVSVAEIKEPEKPKNKVKDKRFKNPNRTCGKRLKSRMKKNIQDDLLFANDIHTEDLSSVENSPSVCNLEKYITKPLSTATNTVKEYFDEVSGRFHSSVTDSDNDSFQIVFNDIPKRRRSSDCESEDSFIVFEDSPDSCYTSNDVFGDTSDEEDYSDSDVSDSGCENTVFNLPSCLSKSICNLADDSLYVDRSEDEVDCAKVTDVCDIIAVETEEVAEKTGLLLDERKKRLRKDLPPKRVQFSEKPPKVHVMRVWTFAARQARAGHWERYTLDRNRFKRRIDDVEVAVSWVLKPQHRSRIMFQRFMPWWNAQRRKELAEKKEREENLKEERLKAEAELKAEEEKKEEESQAEVERTAEENKEETDSKDAVGVLYNEQLKTSTSDVEVNPKNVHPDNGHTQTDSFKDTDKDDGQNKQDDTEFPKSLTNNIVDNTVTKLVANSALDT